jgi:hypothetical protein
LGRRDGLGDGREHNEVSAWIVDRAHIDVLVQGLAESETVTDVDPDTLGQKLWRENLVSVAYRYPGDGDGERPGPMDFRDADVDEYVYRRPGVKIEPGQLMTAIACYAYQSCEHPDWVGSEVEQWTSRLYDQLVNAGVKRPDSGSPGAMEAWGYTEAVVHPRVVA